MSSREKHRSDQLDRLRRSVESGELSSADVDRLSDRELEDLLFEPDVDDGGSLFNLPTIAGLSLIAVGIGYLFQQMGVWQGVDLTMLANMLPVVAGILIILVGFGVLSWRPERKEKKMVQDREIDATPEDEKSLRRALKSHLKGKHDEKSSKLTKSRYNKKISGVCGGLAEYFNIDATLVRIIFVAGTIFSSGTFILLYLALVFILDSPDDLTSDEVISIIRDS